MTEEGPEPQELFEQAEHSHHHAEEMEREEGAEHKKFTMNSAITASILAVLAALGSLLSGHAANEAILKTVEASDQWAFYQANSTKAHLFESNRALIEALKGSSAKPDETSQFDEKLKKYNTEKEEVRKKAETLEQTAHDEFAKHQKFSLAVACFQIGIVLSSVAILVRSRWLFAGAIAAGIIGLLVAVIGLIAG